MGFEADWRDAYPGVNALTLMTLNNPADKRIATLAPVVRFAVERKMARGIPDYWDHATLLELAVMAGDFEEALDRLGRRARGALLSHGRRGPPPESSAHQGGAGTRGRRMLLRRRR